MAVHHEPDESPLSDAVRWGPPSRPKRSPSRWGLQADVPVTPSSPQSPRRPSSTPPPTTSVMADALRVPTPAEAPSRVPPTPEPPQPAPSSAAPAADDDDDGVVTLRVPKAILESIIKEILMSQNANVNNATDNLKNAGESVSAAASDAAAAVGDAAAAAADTVQAASQSVKEKLSEKSSKINWRSVGTHTAAAVAGVGATIGAYFLGRRYGFNPLRGNGVEG